MYHKLVNFCVGVLDVTLMRHFEKYLIIIVKSVIEILNSY